MQMLVIRKAAQLVVCLPAILLALNRRVGHLSAECAASCDLHERRSSGSTRLGQLQRRPDLRRAP
jgi:hypothetical protein